MSISPNTGSLKRPTQLMEPQPLLMTKSTSEKASAGVRVFTTVIALCSLAVLLVAAGLDPSPNRLGTHMQLGFAPCRWITYLDIPCPTCGMTTAFANVTHGRLLEGFLSQPFGFLLAIVTAMTFWLCLFVSVTGSTIYRTFVSWWRPSVVWVLAGAAFLAWMFKIWSHLYGGEHLL